MSARIGDKPVPGFYKVRRVRNGPHVPACITYSPTPDPVTGEPLDRSWWYSCSIEGALTLDPSPDPWRAVPDSVNLHGIPIDEAEYRFLMGAAAWDRAHAPDAPGATPDRAIDLMTAPPPF